MRSKFSIQALLSHKNWIFDMDGTLTIAQHDFDEIRRELGLPEGLPILESLADLPECESASLHHQLDDIEFAIASESKPAEGAAELLEKLLSEGVNIGILTRNNKVNIDVTLKAAGLAGYFKEENLLSRDCASPKPSPAGIQKLLLQWQAENQQSVMVGDHLHDLLAGRAAGAISVYVDPSKSFEFKDDADVLIAQLTELMVQETALLRV